MDVSQEQLQQAQFWRKLMRLTRGRIPILSAMQIVIAETRDETFRATLEAVTDTLEEGSSLSDALAGHEGVFSLAVRELVRSAEKSGAWDELLAEIAGGLADGTFE